MKTFVCLCAVAVGMFASSEAAEAQTRGAQRGGALPGGSAYASEVRHPTVARVQRALARHGYYVGLTSGEFAAETRAAIRRYQRDRGLRMSGKIDGALLRSLGLR
jgi:peptidoglycan hydrolase-like protein with peptidoglycan-binding domain